MAFHCIKTVQKIPASLSEVWDFFSNPANLQIITPETFKFRILSGHQGTSIYPGQIIEYKVSPLFGIPLYWMTEITQVKEKTYFVDEQRKGPFSLWRHQHHFKTIDGGVEMTDIIQYKNPGWSAGRLLNLVLIRRRLKKIMEYRMRQVEKVVGKWPDGTWSMEIS